MLFGERRTIVGVVEDPLLPSDRSVLDIMSLAKKARNFSIFLLELNKESGEKEKPFGIWSRFF
jgi:hypothetical protein